MPICYFCKEFTSIQEKNETSGDIQCSHCGRTIMNNGKIVLSAPKAESTRSKEKQVPTFILMTAVLLVAMIFILFYTTQKEHLKNETLPLTPSETVEIPPVPEENQEIEAEIPVLSSLDLLLLDQVQFGMTASEMLGKNPELFALSEVGNHYAHYDAEATTSWLKDCFIERIYYFYDSEGALVSVEYVLEFEVSDENIQESMSDIVENLSDEYKEIESTDSFVIWEAEDGFVGMEKEQKYIHLTETEERIRSIFK